VRRAGIPKLGDGATARLDNGGHYSFVRNIPGFSKGWTHIAGTAVGSLLFYDAQRGEGATARLDNGGNYTFVRNIPGFSTGSTNLAGS
jgi:hypothetical protein